MPARDIAHPTTRGFAPRVDTHRAAARINEHQLEHGARAITAVINASLQLQRLRNRAAALERALARLKARQADSAA